MPGIGHRLLRGGKAEHLPGDGQGHMIEGERHVEDMGRAALLGPPGAGRSIR
jgi:hypothetical protein